MQSFFLPFLTHSAHNIYTTLCFCLFCFFHFRIFFMHFTTTSSAIFCKPIQFTAFTQHLHRKCNFSSCNCHSDLSLKLYVTDHSKLYSHNDKVHEVTICIKDSKLYESMHLHCDSCKCVHIQEVVGVYGFQ